MNDLAFKQMQVAHLRRLLGESPGNPVIRRQLESRLATAESELAEASSIPGNLLGKEFNTTPTGAIFLSGGGVGENGVRSKLAGEAIIAFEGMFVAQAMHDERIRAGKTRRPKGSKRPELLLVGTPSGSFGLEFMPQSVDEQLDATLHSRSLEIVADLLVSVAENSNGGIDDHLSNAAPGVVPHLKNFLGVLADHGTNLRLAFSNKDSRTLSAESIRAAGDRHKREIVSEQRDFEGVIRGLLLESGMFDLKTDDDVISGPVSEAVSDEELDRIYQLTNQRCIVRLEVTTYNRPGQPQRFAYVLLSAKLAKTVSA